MSTSAQQIMIPMSSSSYQSIKTFAEKSQSAEKIKTTKCLPDPCFVGCLLDTTYSILRFERPRSQRALTEPDEMRLEFSPNHSDAYTDAKRPPRRTAPNVLGISIDITVLSTDIIVLTTDGIVFREYRTKETAVGEG